MLKRTLLPRSYMVADGHEKLTGILGDFQAEFEGGKALVAGSYDIDGLDEEGLRNMMESFSVLTLYNSLPQFYHGALANSIGTMYGVALEGGKIGFMRRFVREMLRLRKEVGVVQMFDLVLGMLGVASDEFVVLQDFIYHDDDVGDSVVPRAIYVSKLAGRADYEAASGLLTWRSGSMFWGFKAGDRLLYEGSWYTVQLAYDTRNVKLLSGPTSPVVNGSFTKYRIDPVAYGAQAPSYQDLFPSVSPGFCLIVK